MPVTYKEDANGKMVATYVPSTTPTYSAIPTKTTTTPTPVAAIIPTAPKVATVAPVVPKVTTASVASNAEQIAALQAQAAAQYAKTGSWSDPTITALHNQVVALQSGTGNAYNPSTGAWAPTTVTPAAAITPVAPIAPVVAPPTALQQMMDLIAKQQQIAPPAYQQPDYSIIPQAQKGVSATANAADTTFLPTSHYNDRVATQKEAINAQANQAYNANLGSYNASQNASQNQLANMASLLPYTEMTASAKATLEQSKAEAELSRQIQAQKDVTVAATDAEQKRQFDLTYALDKQTTDYNTSKPLSAAGGITPYQSYEIDRNGQQDDAKIYDQARELASKDARVWDGSEAQKTMEQDLITAYISAGYDPSAVRADARFTNPPEGYFSSTQLYNNYVDMLQGQQNPSMPGNPQ